MQRVRIFTAPDPEGMLHAIELWTRPGTWDVGIAGEVISRDYYFLRSLKNDGGEVRNCIDVGGHIGSFSAFVKHLWPDARVTAYEASPDNEDVIGRNAAAHRFNLKLGALVGETPPSGKIAFCTADALPVPQNTGGGAVSFQPTSYREVDVHAFGVEDIFSNLKDEKTVDLMKFDCEGSEGPILTALSDKGLLKHVGWIRGEFHGGSEMIDTLRKALEPTHESMFTPKAAGLGFFIAHNRQGPTPYEA